MPNLFRDGLQEALEDFGVDSIFGFGFDLEMNGSLQVTDLQYNLMPAIRARGYKRINAAPAVGFFGGASIHAPTSGMWIRDLVNLSVNPILFSFGSNYAAGGAATGMLLVGDEANEVRAAGVNSDFLGPDGFVISNGLGAALAVGAALSAAPALWPTPMWCPPLVHFNVGTLAVNILLDVAISVQFTAQNPGRLP